MLTTEKTLSAWAWVTFSISSFIVEGGLSMHCHDVQSTSKVVQLHSSLSLACAFRRECFESLEANASLIFWKMNDTKMTQEQYRFNETVSIVTIKHFDAVKGYLTCHINIKGAPNILHRFTIKAGLPPEKPKNISCVSYREKNFTCSWDQGHETFIETSFTLIRIIEKNGNDTCMNSKKNTCSFLFPQMHISGHHKMFVVAENALGRAWSDPLNLDVWQTYRTGPPQNVSVFSIRGQSGSLLVTWLNPTALLPDVGLLYNIQYKMAGATKWIQVTEKEEIINNSFVIKNLKPFTNYTVAVRCIGKEQTKWSDWSSKETGLTGEAKPLAAPELWRQIKHPDSQGNKEIHLQWKALNKSKANGIILGYRIRSEKRTDHTVIQEDNTTSLNYSLLLTDEAYVLTVVAYNSAGDSPEAILIVPAINDTDTTSVQYVNVTSQNNRLLIQWTSPTWPDNGYIIEWCLFLDTNPCAGPLHWQHEENTTEMVYLHGDFEPFVCYNISVYAVFNEGPGNPLSILAYLQQSYPAEGPGVTHKIMGTEALLKWQEIPLEKRRGFITNYTIFYKSAVDENAVPLKPNVFEYTLKTLQKSTEYSVYVMASTVKGGKNSSLIFFKTNGNEQEEIVMIVVPVLLCLLLLMIGVLACFNNQRRIKKCFWPEVADPAGSSMAEWLQKQQTKNAHVLKIPNPGSELISDFSTVEDVCLSRKDMCLSLHTAVMDGSPTLFSPQESITDGTEMDRLLPPADLVIYTVLEESYKSQVPANSVLPEQPISSTVQETNTGDQGSGQNTDDEEEDNWWQPNTDENDLLQQIIKDNPYLNNSSNITESQNEPDPDGSINSEFGNSSQVDMIMPEDTGTLDQNQYNAHHDNHPVKPVQTYITLELLGLKLNKGI
ncbi:interleukin-6 receptor subunit beta-like isoform X1 [Amblyraja radiata]|uniref:interleukin-6 receptor subunit beta-like isoform X1 n=1 Tax=Amblyraja radiata TaxID=386614 RepID=UPI001401D6C6|nr:interleukin-6 receptor subunit beta-like isoform X1 [Amblyraja radiata]XP_032886302.1 interleukin-6 receptor subunit beta-like isoform X1 [Amblyraja radiata]XP_032886310.1 interleukin-6 receptor subunit beta-like isoform X1 [Amblyraja radiata]